MQTLLQDLRYATRQLIRNLGLTITAVVSLALGIGATTAVFSVIYATIALAKNDVSDRLKTRAAPRFEERIDLGPSVEHDGYTVLLKHSIRFRHRRLEPI